MNGYKDREVFIITGASLELEHSANQNHLITPFKIYFI